MNGALKEPQAFVLADREPLLDLLNRALTRDRLGPDILEEKVWADPGFDAELCLGLEHRGCLAGWAQGVVRQGQNRPLGFIKLMAVEPRFQGLGLGSRLLQALEARLSGRGVERVRLGESAPNYLWPGLDVGYTRAMLFFEKHGYRKFGQTYNLGVSLCGRAFDPRSKPRFPEGEYRFRRASARDRPAFNRFLDAHWPAWRAEAARAFLNLPISLHLALLNGRIAAFAAFDCNNIGHGWFGPMGTAKAHRGRGLGSVLLLRCLRDMRKQGLDRAIIPWVGPIGFYARQADASIERVFFRYEKALSSIAASG